MLAIWRQTRGKFFADVRDRRNYNRPSRLGPEEMSVIEEKQRKRTRR